MSKIQLNTQANPSGIVTWFRAQGPSEIDDTDAGISIDLNAYGTRVHAAQNIGGVGGSDTPTLAGKLQQSADGGSWEDVAGAVFTNVTTSNNIQTLTFTRTMRYVRHARTVSGTSPTFVLDVLIGAEPA